MSYTEINDRVGATDVVVAERRGWFSPGRAITLILGVVVAAVGAIVLMRTGVDSDLAHPSTTILSVPQSAIVGLAEVVAGLLLILSSLSEDARPLAAVVGILAIAAGIIAMAASPTLQDDIGFAASTGWWAIVVGIIALVASVLPSVWRVRRDVVAR